MAVLARSGQNGHLGHFGPDMVIFGSNLISPVQSQKGPFFKTGSKKAQNTTKCADGSQGPKRPKRPSQLKLPLQNDRGLTLFWASFEPGSSRALNYSESKLPSKTIEVLTCFGPPFEPGPKGPKTGSKRAIFTLQPRFGPLNRVSMNLGLDSLTRSKVHDFVVQKDPSKMEALGQNWPFWPKRPKRPKPSKRVQKWPKVPLFPLWGQRAQVWPTKLTKPGPLGPIEETRELLATFGPFFSLFWLFLRKAEKSEKKGSESWPFQAVSR